MRTLLRLWLLLLAFVPIAAQAQAPGAPLSCDGKLYQTRQAVSANTFTTLYRVNRTTTPYTTDRVQLTGQNNPATYGDLGVRLNAVGYNQVDGYLYAVTYPDVNGTSPNPGAEIYLYKIGLGGQQQIGRIYVGAVTTPLAKANYAGGAIDKNGIMYISTENSTNTMYRINLNTVVVGLPVIATSVSLGANYALYDLAINPLNNDIYGSTNEGQLRKLVLNTAQTSATVTDVSSSTAVNGASHPVGTLFFDAAGTLLAASNGTFGGTDDGNFYVVDVSGTRSVWVKVTTLPRSAQSDGASCVFPEQKIDVTKDLISVTLLTGQANGITGYRVKYLVKVKNTATEVGVNATNIQVSDFLFRTATGDNTSNITFTTANAVGTGNTNSRVDSVLVKDDDATVSYTANSSYNGTSGTNGSTAGLLATGQTLNQGKTIFIRVTATVRYTNASNAVPSATQLNTAIGSSSSVTNPGYRLDATSGTLLPPIDLLAADQSTDGTTLPSSPNDDVPAPTPLNFGGSIVGNIFEDINYGGGDGRTQTQAGSGGVGVPNVRVELYNNNANKTYRTFTTTDADGFYSFTGLTGGTNYIVRVVNGSVRSTRPGGAAATTTIPVQTYANGSKVGGNFPNGVDAGNSTGNMPAASQSTVTVAAQVGDPGTADFGFNFDLVVNTNASGQGSLSQFITNSNTLLNDNTDASTANDLNQDGQTPGQETSIFMIPTAALTNGVAVINQSSAALPAITDKYTSIDGATQTANTTTSTGNSNSGTLGTSGTVGTAATAFTAVERPEIQIVGSNARAIGLDVSSTATGTVINGLSIYGFGTGTNTTDANIRVAANNTTITNNVVGASASSFAGAPVPPSATNIRVSASSNVTINNNLIGYAGTHGIIIVGAGSTNNTISANEIRGNGTAIGYSGISIAGSSTTVQNNLIVGNNAQGVDTNGSTGSNTISGNTVTGNGIGNNGGGTSGIRIYGTGSSVANNIVNANYGPGVMVVSTATNNTISQNSISSNGAILGNNGAPVTGQLGIDLLNGTDNVAGVNANPVTLNDNGDGDAGGNGLLNFPVLTTASIGSANLVVNGFTRPNTVVEFFLASQDPTGFGEGLTFLAARTEGAAGIDTDTGTGSYSGAINGLNQGTDNTNRFTFTIPLSSLTATQIAALQSGTAVLTSTATSTTQGTSEFSGNLALPVTDITVSLAGATTLYAGQETDTYTATFTNQGPITAPSVGRVITLPAGATLTSAQQQAIQAAYPGASFGTSGGAVTINFGTLTSLAVNATSTVSFAFTAPTTVSSSLTLTAATSTTQSEGADNAPNQVVLTLKTIGTVDVASTITAAVVGTNGTFNVSFTNAGPQTAAGVTRSVRLPAFLQSVTVTGADAGAYDYNTGVVTYSTSTLASGGSLTSTISYPLASAPAAPVMATATVATTTDEHGLTANNVSMATMPVRVDVTTTLSGPASVLAGSPMTLLVTTTNNGPNTAATVNQTVTIPSAAALTNVFITNGGTYAYSGGVGTVTFPPLSNVASTSTVSNSISFLAPSANFAPSAAVTTSSTETNTGNNSAFLNGAGSSTNVAVATATANSTNESTTITATLAGGAPATIVSPLVTLVYFNVTATNNGPTATTNVVQQVQLPPGLGVNNMIVGGLSGTQNGNVISFGGLASYNTVSGILTFTTLGTQASGATETFPAIGINLPASTGNDGQLVVTAVVRTGLSDNVPADNVASVGVKVRTTPELATTIVGPTSAVAGLPASYVVSFANTGSADAANVTETAQLPAGLSGVVVTNASGAVVSNAYNSTTGLVTFPSLSLNPAGATQSFTIVLTTPAQSFPISSAISTPTTEATLTSNTAGLRTTVSGNGDLAVSISGPETAVAGNPVTYIVTTTNNGPTTATNVVPTVQLPTGLTLLAAGSNTPLSNYTGTGLLTFGTVGSLPAGGSVVNYVTFTMPAEPTDGYISGLAAVSSATTDLVASNNSAGLTTSVAPATSDVADLLTSITSPSSPVVPGASLSYSVAYRNAGPNTAVSVVPTAYLPTGLAATSLQVGGVTGTLSGDIITFNSGPASGATYNTQTGELTFPTLATLAPSTTATSYTVAFPAPVGSGQLVVSSAVTSVTTDNLNTNNQANSSITISTRYDVTTSLSGPATAVASAPVTYTVTTLNAGASAASTSTTQTVTLPNGVTASNISGGGSQSGSIITWTFATLPAGTANAQVNTFQVTMPSSTLNLSAAVSSANENPNALPNSATLSTTVANIAPVAQNVWNTLRNARGNTANLSASTGYPISSLNATDVNGDATVVSYTITSLPTASQGVLYYNGAVATTAAGLVTDPTKLSFAPNSSYVGDATFTYTATDNGNGTPANALTSPTAIYTIPVAQDQSSTYTAAPNKGGSASNYANGDLIGYVSDVNTSRYTSTGALYNTGTSNGVLVGSTGVAVATISPADATTLGNVGLTFVQTAGTYGGVTSVVGEIRVTNRNLLRGGTYPITITTVDANGGTNTVPASVQIGFGPLPVTLTEFSAKAVNNTDASLTWTTAQEKDNDHFDVERSLDGVHFEKVGQRQGHVNSTITQQYSFTDAGAANLAGTVYYRLKQVDTDGTSALSDVRTVAFVKSAKLELTVFPNPAADKLNVRLNGQQEASTVLIFNTAGMRVREGKLAGSLSTSFDVRQLPAGTYLVQVKAANGQTLISRFVKY